MTTFAKCCCGLSLLVLMASGCEGDSPGAELPYPELVGAWEYTMGSQVTKCMGEEDLVEELKTSIIELRPSADPAGGVVRWDPALVNDGEGCYQRLDVVGSVGSSKTPQTCVVRRISQQTMREASLTWTYNALTFTAMGQTATESGSGKFSFKSGGQMLTCDLTLMGLLKRITK